LSEQYPGVTAVHTFYNLNEPTAIVFLIIITLNMETPIPLLRTVSSNSTNKNIPNIIKDILLELEKEYKFSVVFCSEVSSHTWGLNHKDSDWDVKFIFAYPNSTYFSPNEPIRTLKKVYGEIRSTGDIVGKITNLDIEISGMDIRNFGKHLLCCNNSVIDLCASHITYKSTTYYNKIVSLLNNLCPWINIAQSYSNHAIKYAKAVSCSKKLQLKGYKAICYGLRNVLVVKWFTKYQKFENMPLNIDDLLHVSYDKTSNNKKMKDFEEAIAIVQNGNGKIITNDEYIRLSNILQREAEQAKKELDQIIVALGQKKKDTNHFENGIQDVVFEIVQDLEHSKNVLMKTSQVKTRETREDVTTCNNGETKSNTTLNAATTTATTVIKAMDHLE
jgi:predicted nucleotidyltransferase